MARDCDFFRGAVILINRLGLFYENKHTYIGYTVGFSQEARWCCFPFTAFFSPPPSISLPLPSPPSTVNRHFILTVPLFLYCWEPSVIYLGGPSSVSVSFQKKGRRKDTFPHNLHRELNRFWQIILASHYLRKRSSQFLSKLTSAFFSPRPQNKRVRNHRINWAKGANLPKCLWSNKWEERGKSVLIYPLFQVPFSLWRPQDWME